MEITEDFVRDILKADYPEKYQKVYDDSPLLQYLDRKMKAVHGGSKTRRSLANIYAIYSILHFYQADYFEAPEKYREFEGYDYMRLFRFYRSLYGGSKLQNHALNSRVNGEFKNRYPDSAADLIIINTEISMFILASRLKLSKQRNCDCFGQAGQTRMMVGLIL